MIHRGNPWVIVLAGGEGSRLRSLTTTVDGVATPKQYCSLVGGVSLLENTLLRASAIAAHERICVVVAAHHRHWWTPLLLSLHNGNLIVEPKNRGTATGILLPLLHILERDTEASIVLLPADHYVQDEVVLTEMMRRAVADIARGNHDLLLLGIEPDGPDPELGYILPGLEYSPQITQVADFIEKPSETRAQHLIDQGALWHSFIFAARGRALLHLYNRSYPEIVKQMHDALLCDGFEPDGTPHLSDLYQDLPEMDFSRDLLQWQEANCQVLAVPHCGWSDLGTPRRVAATLQHLPQDTSLRDPSFAALGPSINLAARVHSPSLAS